MRLPVLVTVIGISMMNSGLGNSTPVTADCGCEGSSSEAQVEQAAITPKLDQIDGNGVRAHDPSMAKEGRSYTMFCTGPGISMRSSTDRVNWTLPIRVFEKALPWTNTTIPGSRDFYWAPDISFFNHKWHLYYAVSTFGKNRSAIGLATNATLDPKSPSYKWVDEGPAFQSYATDNYNAIDPNISFDEKGKPWLSVGSFWSGIKILPIDLATGMPERPKDPPIGIANRPEKPGAIEAPFIVRHGRSFYLFSSFDFCCRGIRSTYNIRVGRSSSIFGSVPGPGRQEHAGGWGDSALSLCRPVVRAGGQLHPPRRSQRLHRVSRLRR